MGLARMVPEFAMGTETASCQAGSGETGNSTGSGWTGALGTGSAVAFTGSSFSGTGSGSSGPEIIGVGRGRVGVEYGESGRGAERGGGLKYTKEHRGEITQTNPNNTSTRVAYMRSTSIQEQFKENSTRVKVLPTR